MIRRPQVGRIARDCIGEINKPQLGVQLVKMKQSAGPDKMFAPAFRGAPLAVCLSTGCLSNSQLGWLDVAQSY